MTIPGGNQGSSTWKIVKKIIIMLLAIGLLALIYADLPELRGLFK
jgi:hypothetical protein